MQCKWECVRREWFVINNCRAWVPSLMWWVCMMVKCSLIYNWHNILHMAVYLILTCFERTSDSQLFILWIRAHPSIFLLEFKFVLHVDGFYISPSFAQKICLTLYELKEHSSSSAICPVLFIKYFPFDTSCLKMFKLFLEFHYFG
jgi:hypothetical protein